MILGRFKHPPSAAFDEINAAVEALTLRTVCFNAHEYPHSIPDGAVVFNLENPAQVCEAARREWEGHELWDFSERNAAELGAKHVPVGYHPSMERFRRRPSDQRDIDVVFTGCMNERRAKVLDELRMRGLHVVHVPSGSLYGFARDAILARAKLALNMLFYEDGTFPALRVAHLVANRIPVLSETCPEEWNFVPTVAYEDLVDAAEGFIKGGGPFYSLAEDAFAQFKVRPLVLPS